jgi:nucleolar protein 56
LLVSSDEKLGWSGNSTLPLIPETPSNVFGDFLKKQVEDRLKFYESGEAPRKNIDVMKEAIQVCLDFHHFPCDPPTFSSLQVNNIQQAEEGAKKKKKKNKKRKAEDADADVTQEDTSMLYVTNGESKKKKKKSKANGDADQEPEAAEVNLDVSTNGKSKKKKKKSADE